MVFKEVVREGFQVNFWVILTLLSTVMSYSALECNLREADVSFSFSTQSEWPTELYFNSSRNLITLLSSFYKSDLLGKESV